MKIVSEIRELFWPLMDPVVEKEFKDITIEEIKIADKNIEDCYDLTFRYYDSENERKKTVESKSTIFIGSIGFVIAILLNMTTGVLLNSQIPAGFLKTFSIIMWVVVVVYLSRAIWFSIKALEKRGYNTIGHSDYIKERKEFKRELIIDIINKVRKNSMTINLKVDDMVMAQLYFKRGIVAIVLYSLIAMLHALIPENISICKEFVNLLELSKCNWLTILNVCFLLVNAVTLSYLFSRNKKE